MYTSREESMQALIRNAVVLNIEASQLKLNYLLNHVQGLHTLPPAAIEQYKQDIIQTLERI